VGLSILGCYLRFPTIAAAAGPRTAITAVWANDGEDKVTQDELRASLGAAVNNRLWNGRTISISGAQNETVTFNLILEAAKQTTGSVSVNFDRLAGPNGAVIHSQPINGDNGVFNYVDRPIENFYVRYIQVNGISTNLYDAYHDERQVPEKMRRPWTGNGVPVAGTGWIDRPDHNKFYPDVAVPLEAVPRFDIAAGKNQAVWTDIYIPKNSPPGLYTGQVTVQENGQTVKIIPVQLKIYNFALPDQPSSKTMLYVSPTDIYRRFLTGTSTKPSLSANDANIPRANQILDRYYFMAKRHGITVVSDPSGIAGDCSTPGQPCRSGLHRLQNNFYTAANGYDGWGAGTSQDLYVVGMYGCWNGTLYAGQCGPGLAQWADDSKSAMQSNADAWETWFERNHPQIQRFIYLTDESTNYSQTEQWANWISSDPGPGHLLQSFATIWLPNDVFQNVPSLSIYAHPCGLSAKDLTQSVAQHILRAPAKLLYGYNGARPACGSWAIEDEGTSLREIPWAQHKQHMDRWFYYYANQYANGGFEPDLFVQSPESLSNASDPSFGSTNSQRSYNNGEGLLFYPGTDVLYPNDSYGLDGPIASLRLKYWRRGIEDVAYLTMASAINPLAVQLMVNNIIPKVAWEYDVVNPSDPNSNYQIAPISWSNSSTDWEAAREQLANIIIAPTLRR
jgi:hypothetical protein